MKSLTDLVGNLDKNGDHFVILVQAKGGKDHIGIVQTTQDIRFSEQRFSDLVCRTIAVQFMGVQVVALFELTLQDEDIRVVEERHYRLVPAEDIKHAS